MHSKEKTRRIWVLADAHIGHVSDDRDGGEWLQMSVEDVKENLGRVDWVVNLGDVTHESREEQLEFYARIRSGSGIGRWYEMPGNHDMGSVGRSTYDKWVGCPRYWSMIDGNLAFFSLPAERGNAAGLFVPEVESWLRENIAKHEVKNIIICAHQLPRDTVEKSDRGPRGLYPRAAVEKFLDDIRVDLWLGGHIHLGRRTPAASVSKFGTVFINVASVSHTYGTELCNSFLLEIEDGSGVVRALCRDHDNRQFLEDQEVTVELTHRVELGSDGPVFTSFDLDVPVFYRGIHDEEVTDFSPYRES